MLLLNSQSWTIEGIQVFADHADPAQFWYLPGPVRLSRRKEDGRAEFTFLKVRAAQAGTDARGGGFLMLTVDMALDPALERRILAKLAGYARGRPRLSVVPFDEGTVRVIALDLDSGGGATPRPPLPAGGFRAVETALGATTPALDAANRASFSLTLTQEGATILDEAFQKGGSPVGVIYDLKYSGMRPSLEVTITANMDRVYRQFASSGEAQVMFLRTGIDQAFERLVQNGAIKVKVLNFANAADAAEKETWALNFFKDHLMATCFTPSLTLGTVTGGLPTTEGLDAVLTRANQLRPPPTPAPARPTEDEAPRRPAHAADPADSATVGTGRGGRTPGTAAAPPEGAEEATDGTGEAAGAATPAQLGTPAQAGLTRPAAPGLPQGAAAPAPASQGPQAVASFRFRGIAQEERKTLTFSYSRAEAAQRSYAPQGFVGLLAADLDRASHFMEIDLDDPFFRVMDIRVNTLANMSALGLKSVEVALSYGKPTDPGGVKHKDLRFQGDAPAEQGWQIFQNRGEVQEYDYTVQYHFDPASGFDGKALAYTFGPFRTSDRTLVLNPHDHLAIATIQVAAGAVDWGQVARIDVALQNGARKRVVTLTEAAPAADWKLRFDDPADRTVAFTPSFVMQDRAIRPGTRGTTDATTIQIDDPFPEALELQLIPILDPARTRMAFVDFAYADPALHYSRKERIRLTPDDTDRPLRIGLPRGARRSFDVKLTIVPTSGAMVTTLLSDQTETLIPISD
ncbi:MAG: hypothetical protein LPJ95_08930 [Paracoccaceae bacterium]|nr:hypothetical protein [Paracoccaceae bacterium]